LQLVDRDHTEALRRVAPVVEMSNRADLRWVSGPLRIWAAYLKTAAGDHKQGVRELVATLPVIERGMLGAPNYPVILHYMTAGFWLAGDAAHLDVLEVNLHAKVLEPDFSYAESDGRWTAALLCAMTGRTDEARRWFQWSLDRLTDQGAILLLPHVCCDAAQMEVHLGPAGDRRHGLARLDDAQRWADRIGLPSFEPVIGDLRVQLPS
jgi:hypothetical protein